MSQASSFLGCRLKYKGNKSQRQVSGCGRGAERACGQCERAPGRCCGVPGKAGHPGAGRESQDGAHGSSPLTS